MLCITDINDIKQQRVKYNLDDGRISEGNLRNKIKEMMVKNWKRYMEEERQSIALKSKSSTIKHRNTVITGKKSLKKFTPGNPNKNESESDSEFDIVGWRCTKIGGNQKDLLREVSIGTPPRK